MLTFRGRSLVRRGPRQHERHVRQRQPGRGRRRRSASATRSRSARSGSGSSDRAGDGRERCAPLPQASSAEITPAAALARGAAARVVAAALLVGSVSLELARHSDETAATRRLLAGRAAPSRDLPRGAARGPPRAGPHRPADRPGPAAGGRPARRDQPAAHGAAAAGPRRPALFGAELGLADASSSGSSLSISIATTLAIVVRSDRWLRLYKYTWAAVGVGLLLLTFVFGTEVNGARLTLTLGPFSGQPSELLKVILVVFLAGYLSENRPLLVEESTRIGPDRAAAAAVPRADGRDVGDRARHRGRPARPRRGAAVLRRVPAAAVRRDRRGSATSSSGSLLFVAGGFVMYQLVPHVRTRVDIWLDPFADPAGDRLPGHPGALRVRPRRPRSGRAWAAACRRSAAAGRSRDPHRLPVRRARRGARAGRGSWRSWGCTSSSSSAACGSPRRPATTSGRCSPPAWPSSSASRRSSSRPATSS